MYSRTDYNHKNMHSSSSITTSLLPLLSCSVWPSSFWVVWAHFNYTVWKSPQGHSLSLFLSLSLSLCMCFCVMLSEFASSVSSDAGCCWDVVDVVVGGQHYQREVCVCVCVCYYNIHICVHAFSRPWWTGLMVCACLSHDNVFSRYAHMSVCVEQSSRLMFVLLTL